MLIPCNWHLLTIIGNHDWTIIKQTSVAIIIGTIFIKFHPLIIIRQEKTFLWQLNYVRKYTCTYTRDSPLGLSQVRVRLANRKLSVSSTNVTIRFWAASGFPGEKNCQSVAIIIDKLLLLFWHYLYINTELSHNNTRIYTCIRQNLGVLNWFWLIALSTI